MGFSIYLKWVDTLADILLVTQRLLSCVLLLCVLLLCFVFCVLCCLSQLRFGLLRVCGDAWVLPIKFSPPQCEAATYTFHHTTHQRLDQRYNFSDALHKSNKLSKHLY